MPHFDALKMYIIVENIVRKGEIACNKQFLLFSVFSTQYDSCFLFYIHFNPFPNKPWFLRVCSIFFENNVGKGEIARYEQFLLFPQCFLPIWMTFCHFHYIWNCRLQTFWI